MAVDRGDGGVAREVLKHDTVQELQVVRVLCDIDEVRAREFASERDGHRC